MPRQKFYFRFMCLFILALMATLKIWISTHLMTLQTKVDAQQTQLERLRVRSNQLLLTESELINRDTLRSKALAQGYQAPAKILYVVHP